MKPIRLPPVTAKVTIAKISLSVRYGTEVDGWAAHVVEQADGPDVGLLVVGG
jgi:hypothetical protein